MSYESIYEDTEAAHDAIDVERNESMAALEDAYIVPEPITNVSYEINRLLAEGSDYLTTAQDASEKTARESGSLKSDFWRSAGEASAIDNVGTVAERNVQVELYNQFVQNEVDIYSYSSAYDNYIAALKSGLELIQTQHYNSMQQEYRRTDFGYALESQWYDHQYKLEQQDQLHGYELDYIDYIQEYDLEMKESMFGYNMDLLEQGYGYYMENIELHYATELDSQYRGQAYEQYQFNRDVSTYEYMKFNENYFDVVSSNLEPETKEQLVWDRYEEHIRRQNELGTWKQIGDNPYSYDDYITELGKPPEKGDEAYKSGPWYNSGGVTAESMGGFIDMLDSAFREEMGTKERHRFRTAQQVDWIKEYWPSFSENFKEETEAMKVWFGNVAKSGYMEADEDGYMEVIQDWRDMMMYMSIPGDEHFIPSTSPDDDGNMLNERYSDIELIDGEIVKQYYRWQDRWCKTDKYSGEEICVTEQPDFGDPDGPWENPWTDVSGYDKGYSYIMSGDYY